MAATGEVLAAAAGSFIASSAGFWGYLRAQTKSKSDTSRLIMGLAHDRITFLGMRYIERGYITKDEFEDLQEYLYEPYRSLGGNGTAQRIMHAVQRLPLLPNPRIEGSPNNIHKGPKLSDFYDEGPHVE